MKCRLSSCDSDYEVRRKGAIIQMPEPITKKKDFRLRNIMQKQQEEILLDQYFKPLSQQHMCRA